MPDERISLIIEEQDKRIGALEDLNKDLKETAASSKQADKEFKIAGVGLKQFGVVAAATTGVIVGFAAATKAAFDFTEMGAGINQLSESFASMDTDLQSLRESAGGTIDDVTLMASTMTLTAGAGEEMQAALLDAMPRFIEMARASNKLNPELGDTTFLLESVTTAAKRQSSQIADNLGLIVKQGQANEDYAESIGKLVSELSDEEKQLAFVNGLLKAGDRLIEQVGGSVDSQTDSWARLKVEIKNATDAMKANAAEGALPLVARYADFLQTTRENEQALIGFGAALRFVSAITGIHTDTQRANNVAMRKKLGWTFANDKATATSLQVLDQYNQALGMQTQEFADAAPAAQEFTEEIVDTNKAGMEAAQTFFWMTQAVDSTQTAMSNLSFERAREEAALAHESFSIMASQLDEISQKQFAMNLIQQFRDTLGPGEEFNLMQDAVLERFGLLTPAEVAAGEALRNLAGDFDGTAGSARALAEEAFNVKAGIDAIPNHKRIILEIFERRKVSTEFAQAGFGIGAGAQPPQQALGGVSRGGMTLVGERGPELVNLPQGAQTSTTEVTQNVYNNINTAATTGTYNQDMLLSQQRARARR